ncbi:MAG TPA: hypothetical protein VIL04_09925 [Solirubrobacterales bacterium]|jgi:nitrite reductase (NO-forming)
MERVGPDTVGDRAGRRCRARPRRLGELRPTDVVGAFFVAGIAFVVAGVIVGAGEVARGWEWGRWLALHLVFVGGISQLVLGASQFFLGAFLATDPPPRGLVRAQLASWNAGAILLALGVPLGSDAVVAVAVALLVGGLVAYGAGIVVMRRGALSRAPLAVAWYGSGAAFLALGIVAGAALALGASWRHGNLLSAHMALNLGGWFGAAIVGTLHTFYPSLAKVPLPEARLEPFAAALWVGGVVALAAGYAWAADPLALAGWGALVLAALALAWNVAGCVRAAPRPLSLPARLLGAAQALLVMGLALAAGSAIANGPAAALSGDTRAAVAILLVAGWVGMTVLGSLLHLLAVVVRVRDFSRSLPAPRPRVDVPLAALAAGGVAMLALSRVSALSGLAGPGAGALVLAYAVLLARVLALAAQVLARARPNV